MLETMAYSPSPDTMQRTGQSEPTPHAGVVVLDPHADIKARLLSYEPRSLTTDPDTGRHIKRVRGINEWLLEEGAHPGTLDAFLSGDRSVYHPEQAAEVDRLRAEVAEFEGSVITPEAMIERKKIAEKYQEADAATVGMTREEQVAARIAMFANGGIEIVSDYDNTITDESQIRKVNGVKPGHPGAVVADEVLGKHKDALGFGDAYAGLYPPSFQRVAREFPEAFFENGRTTPLREGAPEFFQFLKAADIPMLFASANLEYTIWGTLSRFPHSEDVRVWSITPDSITAVAKGAVIATEAIENPEKAIVYMGDGESDVPSLEARDVVAAYFALEGSQFARDLEAAGVLYFTYESLTDVSDKLREIYSLVDKNTSLPLSA